MNLNVVANDDHVEAAAVKSPATHYRNISISRRKQKVSIARNRERHSTNTREEGMGSIQAHANHGYVINPRINGDYIIKEVHLKAKM